MTKTVKGVVSGADAAKRQVDIADPAEQKTYRVHFPERPGVADYWQCFSRAAQSTGERV